jgi:hypothetical protein
MIFSSVTTAIKNVRRLKNAIVRGNGALSFFLQAFLEKVMR